MASAGERLRTLRELLGLTQQDLEAASQVAQPWISDVERGHREASEEKLLAIANATGTPIGFFYVAPSSVPLDSLRFRKRASVSRKLTARVQALYGEGYRVTETLVTQEKYPLPDLPYATGDMLTSEQIEDLAEETRLALRLAPDRPIPHLTRALELAGVAVTPAVFTDIDGEQHSATEHFGVSYWGGMGEAALIQYFPAVQGDRDRFTLAHETGHLVMHTFRPRMPKDIAEDEANRFASALLVPRNRARTDIKEGLTLTEYARLKAVWGASIQCLIMRGHAVGNISDTRKRSLFVQLSTRGWRKREPVAVGREEPRLLWTLLARRFGSRPYRAGAEALAIPAAVLRSLAPTPTKPTTAPERPGSVGPSSGFGEPHSGVDGRSQGKHGWPAGPLR